MDIEEQRKIYDALDMCNVAYEHRKTNVFGSIFCLTDFYTFGDYEIEFEKQHPASFLMPKGEVWVRKKELNGSSKLLTSWNEHHPEKQYVYDMYIAAKNRSEGKQYDNPFRLKIMGTTVKTIQPHIKPFTLIRQKFASLVK